MSAKFEGLIKDLAESIKSADRKKTSPYDTPATVTKVEGDIAWVHIPGGVDETPVKKTISCSAGDTVQVRVSGGKAWIQGNASNPPTDDTVARSARQTAQTAEVVANKAGEKADVAYDVASAVDGKASRALSQSLEALEKIDDIADDTMQYFWRLEDVFYARSLDQEWDSSKTYYTKVLDNYYVISRPYPSYPPVEAGAYERYSDTGSHITEVPQDDFMADPVNSGSNLLARSNGIAIRHGLKELSKFSSNGMQIGIDGESRLVTDYHSMQMYDKEGDSYFYISDLRDTSGQATLTYTFHSGSDDTFDLGVSIDTLVSAATYQEGVLVEDVTEDATVSGSTITFPNPIYDLDIVFVITSSDQRLKAYTLGQRGNGVVGPYSVAEGRETVASGAYSHAEGRGSVASGMYSHAEGYYAALPDDPTTASGEASHAEGIQTHAEGPASHAEGIHNWATGNFSHTEGFLTIASGTESHAEGEETEASGYTSHAQNLGTIAQRKSQTALGEYNIADTGGRTGTARGDYVIIVGNGTSSARSNALTVDWSGNVVASGDVTDGSGNVLSDKADTTDLADYLPLTGGTLTGTLNGTQIEASGNLIGEDIKLEIDTTATSGTDHELYTAISDLGWTSDVIE